jgi:opacity protein-like surface antigen
VRHVAAALIATVMAASTLTPSSAQAIPFDGPEAVGATAAAAMVTGIACWTVELAAGEQLRDPEVKDDYARRGFYLGGQALLGLEFIDEKQEARSLNEAFTPFKVDFDMKRQTTGGLSITAGRRCSSRVAVEFKFEWLDDFQGEMNVAEGGRVTDVNISPFSGTINVKAFALTGRIQPFALLGMGFMSLHTDSINTGDNVSSAQTTGLLVVRFGAGVDYYVTRNWVATTSVDYVYSATNLKILDYMSFGMGLQYRF